MGQTTVIQKRRSLQLREFAKVFSSCLVPHRFLALESMYRTRNPRPSVGIRHGRSLEDFQEAFHEEFHASPWEVHASGTFRMFSRVHRHRHRCNRPCKKETEGKNLYMRVLHIAVVLLYAIVLQERRYNASRHETEPNSPANRKCTLPSVSAPFECLFFCFYRFTSNYNFFLYRVFFYRNLNYI